MSLLLMCAYATEENGKLTYLKQTVESLTATVDFGKHRLIIINNSQYEPATEYLRTLPFKVLEPGENLGTAGGINLGLRERKPGEYCIKLDDDWTTTYVGWVDEMEAEIQDNPEIGILGLKRDDVYGEMIPDGNLLWCHDIMGTCTMLNPLLLDRIGAYCQPSKYGYDDTILSVRSEVAGFKNAFMRNIRIVNLDEGGTEYTEWKKQEAGEHLATVSVMIGLYRSGVLDVYWDGGYAE